MNSFVIQIRLEENLVEEMFSLIRKVFWLYKIKAKKEEKKTLAYVL